MQLPLRSMFDAFFHTPSLWWVMVCVSGCGWKTGSPIEVGVHVGDVVGSSVEPGMRAAVRDALASAIREVGALGPRPLHVELLSVEQEPGALTEDGHGVMVTRLDLRVHDPARSECEARVQVQGPWDLGPGPQEARSARASMATSLADQAGQQALTLLMGNPACR